MKMFRVVARTINEFGFQGELYFTDFQLKYEEYPVIRETPKGYWIEIDRKHISHMDYEEEQTISIEKWVSKTSLKRYAYPTKEEALQNYIARKNRQINILNRQLKDAKDCLDLARKGKVEETK